MKRRTGVVVRMGIALALGSVPQTGESGDAWQRFRGPDGGGIHASATLPDTLNPDEHLRWKITLPAGTSSPIHVDGRILVTSYADDQRTIHCLNADTGETLWTRSVEQNHKEVATPPANPATPTPATDGERVFVFFPDSGLYAWSLDGELLWLIRSEVSSTMHGLSSSLICSNGRLIQVVDQLRDSFIIARDTSTGAEIWKQDRVSGLTGAYATPVVHRSPDGSEQILVTGPLEIVAYDAATGSRVWWILGHSNAPISSPVLQSGTLYICEPVGEPLPMSMVLPLDADKDGQLSLEETAANVPINRLLERIDSSWGNSDGTVNKQEWDDALGSYEGKGGLLALRTDGTGDQTEHAIRWSYRKSLPQIAGILVHGETVFIVNDGGLVTTLDAATGELLRKGRLKKGTGQYYASPVATADQIVTIDTRGVLNVLSPEADWSVLSTIDLQEPCYATPSISDDRLFVRTESSLLCLGDR